MPWLRGYLLIDMETASLQVALGARKIITASDLLEETSILEEYACFPTFLEQTMPVQTDRPGPAAFPKVSP